MPRGKLKVVTLAKDLKPASLRDFKRINGEFFDNKTGGYST